jgi:hypothetical protein
MFIMNDDVLRSSSGDSSDSGTSSSSGETLDEFHQYILEGGEVLGYKFEPRRTANSDNSEEVVEEYDQNMSNDEEGSVRLANLDW